MLCCAPQRSTKVVPPGLEHPGIWPLRILLWVKPPDSGQGCVLSAIQARGQCYFMCIRVDRDEVEDRTFAERPAWLLALRPQTALTGSGSNMPSHRGFAGATLALPPHAGRGKPDLTASARCPPFAQPLYLSAAGRTVVTMCGEHEAWHTISPWSIHS
jgi:hypothetical protein